MCGFLAASGNDLCCSFKLICGGTYRLSLISSLRCVISIAIQPPSLHRMIPVHWKLPILSFIASGCALSLSAHAVHFLLFDEHSPTTNALTGRPNPPNYPCELEFLQYSCLSALSPCRLDPDPSGFTSQILQLLTPCVELFCLLGSSLSLPFWVR